MDGVAPAVGNAILDAIGINIDDNPHHTRENMEGIKITLRWSNFIIESNDLEAI